MKIENLSRFYITNISCLQNWTFPKMNNKMNISSVFKQITMSQLKNIASLVMSRSVKNASKWVLIMKLICTISSISNRLT